MRRSWFLTAATFLTLLCLTAATKLLLQRATPTAATEAPIAVTEEPAPRPTVPADPVLELFNPSEATLTEQLNASALKNRLEELAVLAFVLRRCEIISEQEYADTYAAIGNYVQHMQPGQPQAWKQTLQAAVESASASYGLLYARTECTAPALRTSAAALAQWRAALNQPPQ